MKDDLLPQVECAVRRLAEIRQMAGLVQADLAEGIGVSKGSISDLESMRSEPRIGTLIRCCDYLGVSIELLFMSCPMSDGASRLPPHEDVLKKAKLLGVKQSQRKWLLHEVEDVHFWLCLAEEHPNKYLDTLKEHAQKRIKNNQEAAKLWEHWEATLADPLASEWKKQKAKQNLRYKPAHPAPYSPRR